MGIKMKTIFLQGLLKRLFTRTPVLAVLLLTAVVTACGGGGGGGGGSSQSSGSPPASTPPPTKANCMFAEDNGTINCGLITLTRVFDYPTNYSITVGEFGKGNTTKIGLGNFTFMQIINGNISDPLSGTVFPSGNQLTLSANTTALNITISGIASNVFGEFYIDLVLVDNDDASVEIRYTISITAVNDAPEFSAVIGSENQFTPVDGATPASYSFAAIPFNSTAGYSVGNVSTTDVDNDTISYSINGGNDDIALFKISSTGEITLKKIAVNPDDSAITYIFNITASDSKGGSAMTKITVSVLSDNQAPMFSASSYTFTGILHNSPLGYSVGNVSATDPDLDTITYSISGEDGDIALFNISSTGEITLIAEATVGVYAFNVTASDREGASTTATISVTVIDATPPAFTRTSYSFNLSLSVANAAGVVVDNVLATDEQRTPFDYSLVNNGGLFELANAKNADGSINITLLSAATLSDFVASSITLLVVATHQDGRYSSLVSTITVNLINDLPFDDDSDSDGIVGFYDAFPDDGAKIVNGDGNSSHPYIISNIYQLQAIAGVDHRGTALDSSIFTNYTFLYGTDAADQLTKHYKLANNIDASNTTNTAVWAKPMVGANSFIGHGWTPIAGGSGQSFNGSFAGEGYHIHNLSMNLQVANNKDTFGLFGTNGGNISTVGVTNINMQISAINGGFTNSVSLAGGGETESYTLGSGALVGTNNEGGSIKYAYSTGIVTVDGLYTGGLVGVNIGKIVYSYSGATVTGRRETGGLVGAFGVPDATSAEISSSYATGDVTEIGGGIRYIQAGGLVGTVARKNSMHSAKIYASYAGNDGDNGIISVKGHGRGGPLIGTMSAGYHTDISYSHWTNSTSASFERDAIHLDSRNSPEEPSFTFLPESGFSDYLFLKELENATLDSDTPRAITTGKIFASPHWNDNLDDPGIERGWIFRDGEIPALHANRTLNSVTTSLMPSFEAQVCHRRLASDACGTYDAVE